jgi:hypothetical protein
MGMAAKRISQYSDIQIAHNPLLIASEAKWSSHVLRIARGYGWRGYHTQDSRRSEPGWPDWAYWRERLLIIELKDEWYEPTAIQTLTMQQLADAGCEVYLWRPRHLPSVHTVLSWCSLPLESSESGRILPTCDARHIDNLRHGKVPLYPVMLATPARHKRKSKSSEQGKEGTRRRTQRADGLSRPAVSL